ncbi:MAG: LTA synthase family protein [Clostridia bacterium]
MSLHRSCSFLPKRFRVLDLLLLFIAPFCMLLLLEGYSRGSFPHAFEWMLQSPLLFLCNYALFLCPCLLLGVLRSDRLRAILSLFLCLFCALLGIANATKILYRMEPILFTDVTQLGDAAATMTNLSFDVDVAQIGWLCAGFVLAAIACFVLLRGKQERRPVLWPAVGILLLLVLPASYTFELAHGSVRTDMVDHARNEGSLYAAIAMENHRHALMRLEYKEPEVRASYDSLVDAMRQEDAQAKSVPLAQAKPNVIVVLSESFTDGAFLGQYLDFSKPVLPFYDEFLKQTRSGKLRVPKLGGGTSETEFEVLTGMRSHYAINPYSMGLPPISSMASVLHAKGYEATAIHWYSGVYYNRYHNLKMLGFDSFYTTDTTTKAFEKKGMFTSDAEHYRAIMSQLQKTEQQDFVFCLTMQNHGGYGYDDFRNTYGAVVPFTDTLSAEGEKVVTNYCYLLSQSDAALRDFISDLQAFEEPTWLVFFGDHIPPFGAEIYEELGIPVSGETGYLTPYFIWSNQQPLSGTQDLKAYELGAYALSLAGLNTDPFLREVERLREGGSAQNARYELLSYDALFGKQYAYNEGNLSPSNPGFQIGGEMALAGFDAAEVGNAVYLRPRLAIADQAFRLSVDGQLRDTRYVLKTDQPLTLQCVMTNSNGTRYNQSNPLTFAGTEALLAQSGSLPYEAFPLWNCEYELAAERGHGDTLLFRSIKPFVAGKNTAVTLGGERLDWQPVYGINKADQYGLNADGTLTLSVSRKKLAVEDGEGFRSYLEQNQGHLIVFED